MEKIRKLPRPTVSAIEYISSTLHKKYKSKYVVVHIQVITSPSDYFRLNYWLDVDGVYYSYFDTWKELTDKFEELMNAN